MTLPVEQAEASQNDRLFALALSVLPHHLLSRLMHAVTRWAWPPVSKRLIRWAVRHYEIDIDEAVDPDLDDYACFNAFFTRALKREARPIDPDPASIVSPVDGQVSQSGIADGNLLFQAKGHYFTLEDLLGDADLAKTFRGGSFATLYLSPRDYHRIHMPVDGRLLQMAHIPGRLFSVNHATTRAVPSLFARNERIVNIFDTPAGPAAVIMVGAIFVGSMDTVWAGTVTPAERRISRWHYDNAAQAQIDLAKGVELGRFNMGSTVILLFAKDRVIWDDHVIAEKRLRFGQRIGRSLTTS